MKLYRIESIGVSFCVLSITLMYVALTHEPTPEWMIMFLGGMFMLIIASFAFSEADDRKYKIIHHWSPEEKGIFWEIPDCHKRGSKK